jgi:hypothetical protein
LTTPKKSRAPLIAVAAMVVLVLVAAGWLLSRKDPVATPAPATQTATTSAAVAAPEVPAAAARLAINAYPWAKVTNIRNLDNGQDVELGSALETPVPVDLPPGRYAVTLSNPNFDEPITRTVSVEAGRDETLNVPFTDPNRAALPNFGVKP